MRGTGRSTAHLETRVQAVEARDQPFIGGDGKVTLTPDTVRGAIAYRGTFTIASGTTSVVVSHVAGLPLGAGRILITPTNSPTSDPGHWWVSAIDDESFTVNCANNPGASGFTGGWARFLL